MQAQLGHLFYARYIILYVFYIHVHIYIRERLWDVNIKLENRGTYTYF